MHRRSVSQLTAALVAVSFTIALVSCATAPARPVVVLPNGYYLTPDKQDQSEIIKRGGRVVMPGPIAAYATSGNLVAGAIGMAPVAGRLYSDQPYAGSSDTKYFILDTSSGKLEPDLGSMQWRERLKELGAPSDFEIYPPLPWEQE